MAQPASYLSAMDDFDIAQLGYLILLLVVVGGYFTTLGRRHLSRTLQQAAIWGLIFLGAIAAVGLWDDISGTALPRQSVATDEGRVEVPKSADGHYHLTLHLNGTPVRFVVDTGATQMVLTQADAERVGINVDDLIFTGTASTANGTVRTARARIDEVALGGIVDRGVSVWVNEGEMRGSLLGMSYLGRYDRIEIADNTLVLIR